MVDQEIFSQTCNDCLFYVTMFLGVCDFDWPMVSKSKLEWKVDF